MADASACNRLPTIDLSLAGSSELIDTELAQRLDQACREFGFFYLQGHGVDTAVVDALMDLSRSFFALGVDEKCGIHMSKGGRAWRGYFRVGDELTSGVPDAKEGIYFGTELDANDARVQANWPLHGSNQFPPLSGFRAAVLQYMNAVTDLGHRLLGLLARGLGLDAHFFVEHYTRDPTILFRIFNYPPQQPSSNRPVQHDVTAPLSETNWGVGAHTDYGLLTLLKQDSIGGLQVRHGEGWIDVQDVPDSFVCNVGDMLERLTSGRYLSALHRARNSSVHNRLSMALFFDPSFTAQLQPIESVQPEREQPHTDVRWDDIDPNQTVGTYGEYLLQKVGRVFPTLRDASLR
jgi:isopenicillin N synthase-like dioxygenase